MSDLPLVIRVAIRDRWDSPNSTVLAAAEELKKDLGVKFVPELNWVDLWSSLRTNISQKEDFVPTIARFLTIWLQRLLAKIRKDEEWAEQLLDALGNIDRPVHVLVEVAAPNVKQFTTKWDKQQSKLRLAIPNTSIPFPQDAQLTMIFDQHFEHLFADSDVVQEDEWAHIEEPTNVAARLPQSPTATPHAEVIPTVLTLPSVDTLTRPSTLLSSPPYIMTVTANADQYIRIDCSHERSLQLLASYLQRWSKTNERDARKLPFFEVKLMESDHCTGYSDTLFITPNSSYYKSINPTIPLAFIEGVLGFNMVHTNGTSWMYRSTKILK